MHLDGRVLASSAWRPSHQHRKELDLIALPENVGERTYGGIKFLAILSIILDGGASRYGLAHGRDPAHKLHRLSRLAEIFSALY